MDPYEYYFNKLGFKLVKKSEVLQSNLKNFYDSSHNEIFNGYDLIWNFFENDHQFGIWFDDHYSDKKKDICRYAYISIYVCSKNFREILNSTTKNFSKRFINNCKIILQTLNTFPNQLTSTSEIDLLLTLNGVNIET